MGGDRLVTYRQVISEAWRPIKSLYALAGAVPRTEGSVSLGQKNSYLYQLHHDHGVSKSRRGKQRSMPNEARNRRLVREPWVLATSLPLDSWSVHRVTRAYRERIQIEVSFRDLKSGRWRSGSEYTGPISVVRSSNLLLLTTLPTLDTCVVGWWLVSPTMLTPSRPIPSDDALSFRSSRSVFGSLAVHDRSSRCARSKMLGTSPPSWRVARSQPSIPGDPSGARLAHQRPLPARANSADLGLQMV